MRSRRHGEVKAPAPRDRRRERRRGADAVGNGKTLPNRNRAALAVAGRAGPSALPVADVRSGLGITRELFARMTGFSVRAISGWESGRPLSEAAMRRVTEMKRLSDALAQGLRPEYIAQWLVTPCEGLGGLKPVEVLERGENDRLWRVVMLIGSGMPI